MWLSFEEVGDMWVKLLPEFCERQSCKLFICTVDSRGPILVPGSTLERGWRSFGFYFVSFIG